MSVITKLTQKTVVEAFGGKEASTAAIGATLAKSDGINEANSITIIRALSKFVPVDKKERNVWKAELRDAYQATRKCAEPAARQAIDRYALCALVWKLHNVDLSLAECQQFYKSDGTEKPAPAPAPQVQAVKSGGVASAAGDERREEADGAANLANAKGQAVSGMSPQMKRACQAFASHAFQLGNMREADAAMVQAMLAAIRGVTED